MSDNFYNYNNVINKYNRFYELYPVCTTLKNGSRTVPMVDVNFDGSVPNRSVPPRTGHLEGVVCTGSVNGGVLCGTDMDVCRTLNLRTFHRLLSFSMEM